MKRIALGALLLAVLAGMASPLYAEDKDNPYVKTREQLKKESEDSERAYQKTLKATRGADPAPAKNDPWADMRGGTNASKSK